MEGSALFYYRNCHVAVVKLTFAVPLGSCVLFFMCKRFKSQPHFIYILLSEYGQDNKVVNFILW